MMGYRISPVPLAIASALLYGAAFPPLGLAPLMWFALVPLLWACRQLHPLAAFLLGCIWSLLVGAQTASFLPEMIATYFDLRPPSAWVASAGAILATGALYGVFAGWVAWLVRRDRATPFPVACAFCACEWARTVLSVPNPWSLSAYSQIGWLSVVQSADLAGPFSVSFLIGAVNAWWAFSLPGRLRWFVPRLASAWVVALFVANLAYGELRLRQHFGDGEPVRVALVQPAIERSHRFRAEYRERNLARQLGLSLQAAGAGDAQLILWPEYALDVALDARSPEHLRLARLSETTHAEVLVGAPSLGPGATRHNTAFLIRGGKLSDRYDKVELMPFAEADSLGGWLAMASGQEISPGASRRPLASAAGLIGVILCNEAMFSAPAREAVRLGAEILANPSNDDWFGERGASHQLEVAALRAIENRRYLMRPTLTGLTAIVDPHGRTVSSTEYGRPDAIVGSVERSNGRTGYQRWGDVPAIAAAIAALVASASPAPRRREENLE
jgi:apolipoprotein N-acyltransferase